MPVPKENKEVYTVEEFIAGAEEWGMTEIYSDETLRAFVQRMMDAADDYECTFGPTLTKKSSKIVVTVYNPDIGKAEKMSDILAGSYKALNGLLTEIFRLRALIDSDKLDQLKMLAIEAADWFTDEAGMSITCDCGNPDGGSVDTCPHCEMLGRAKALREVVEALE